MNTTKTDNRPRTFTFTVSGENVRQVGQYFVFSECTIAPEKREYRHSNPSAYYRLRHPKKKHDTWNLKEWMTMLLRNKKYLK